jgi:cysteinyl-tRNA synthetase
MELRELLQGVRAGYLDAMAHDFNTAGALGKLFELVRETNRFLDGWAPGHDLSVLDEVSEGLAELLQLLGFFPSGLPAGDEDGAVPEEVVRLAAERQAARQARDWARADVLRKELQTRGFIVEDRPDGFRLKPLVS